MGDQIEVPLACAVMEGLAYNSMKIDHLPPRYKTQREREIARRREAGLPMDLSYESSQELLDPFYRNYKCKDERMFYVVCPGHKHHTKRCLQVLGLYDELVAKGLTEEGGYLSSYPRMAIRSLAQRVSPAEILAGQDRRADEGCLPDPNRKGMGAHFGESRIPAGAQRWLQEWISADHARCTGLRIEVNDPAYGRMIQLGPVAWLEESGEAILSPAPRKWVTFDQAVAALSAIAADGRAAGRPICRLDGSTAYGFLTCPMSSLAHIRRTISPVSVRR
ncbi:hypothetical protein [Bradyrhizobium icense]|nr:hypothetical protein [Bradyrhizobium icense]